LKAKGLCVLWGARLRAREKDTILGPMKGPTWARHLRGAGNGGTHAPRSYSATAGPNEEPPS